MVSAVNTMLQKTLRGAKNELSEKSRSFFASCAYFAIANQISALRPFVFMPLPPGELVLNQNAQGLIDPGRVLMPTEDSANIRTRRSLRVGAQVIENLVRHGIASRTSEDCEHRLLAITPDFKRTAQVGLRNDLASIQQHVNHGQADRVGFCGVP